MGSKQTAWESFMADEKWSAIKARSVAEHGTMVGDIQEKAMRLTEYSPTPVSQFSKWSEDNGHIEVKAP